MFFDRLAMIYGVSKMKTIWGEDEAQLRNTRREWANRLGLLSVDQIEAVIERLKGLCEQGHPDYRWPDIPRIIALANGSEGGQYAAHRQHVSALPQPEWRRKQIRELGRLAAQTAMAVLRGGACFIEDKPEVQ